MEDKKLLNPWKDELQHRIDDQQHKYPGTQQPIFRVTWKTMKTGVKLLVELLNSPQASAYFIPLHPQTQHFCGLFSKYRHNYHPVLFQILAGTCKCFSPSFKEAMSTHSDKPLNSESTDLTLWWEWTNREKMACCTRMSPTEKRGGSQGTHPTSFCFVSQ